VKSKWNMAWSTHPWLVGWLGFNSAFNTIPWLVQNLGTAGW